MAPDLEKYYDNQFSLMATEGWKDMIEDFKELEKNLSNIRTVADDHTLHFRLGQLDILDLILKRKETCEQVYEELING